MKMLSSPVLWIRRSRSRKRTSKKAFGISRFSVFFRSNRLLRLDNPMTILLIVGAGTGMYNVHRTGRKKNRVNLTATYLKTRLTRFGPSAEHVSFTRSSSTALGFTVVTSTDSPVSSSVTVSVVVTGANLMTLVIFPARASTMFPAVASPLLLSREKLASAAVENRRFQAPSRGGGLTAAASAFSTFSTPGNPSVAAAVGLTRASS
mmetsp:Transcript_5979/g.14848  ORF Transcript_5979/g.14848 Transcript_5979/m.14848 type:complete len:206 (+) Transcript_5979:395-1012(+)